MQTAPLWILFIVGGVDRKIDEKERAAFNSYMGNVPLLPDGFTLELMLSSLDTPLDVRRAFDSDLQRIMPDEAFGRVATILGRNVPENEALMYKAFLIDLGETIANASGVLFRPKTGKNEKKALILIAVWLDAPPFDIAEAKEELGRLQAEGRILHGPATRAAADKTVRIVRSKKGRKIPDSDSHDRSSQESTPTSKDDDRSGSGRPRAERRNQRTSGRTKLRRTHKWAL